jgi:hypothetical protein
MEYRGKRYSLVQGAGPHAWKWIIHLDENTVKSGEAKSRAIAVTEIVLQIDRALAPGKARLKRPVGA